MPIPIVPPTLTALNNLGGGFPPSEDFQLGDYLNLLSSEALGASVVFRPGDPSPGPNVYDTWAEAFAALQAVQGFRTLQVDDTFASTIVPAGTWDFENTIQIYTPPVIPAVTLTLSDGCVFERLHQVNGLIVINSLSSSPIITTPPGGFSTLLMTVGSELHANGTAPFIAVSDTAFFFFFLVIGGKLVRDASPIVSLGGAASAVAMALLAAAEVQDTIVGPGAFIQLMFSTSPAIATPQTGLTGPTMIQYVTQANNLGYDSAATAADWTPPAPVTVQEAVDRLADAVSGLLGGPIP